MFCLYFLSVYNLPLWYLFSTFLINPFLAFLPLAKCCCLAIFSSWSSLLSLQTPLPCLRAPIHYCATDLPVHMCGPMRGAVTSPWYVLLFHPFISLSPQPPNGQLPTSYWCQGSPGLIQSFSSHNQRPLLSHLADLLRILYFISLKPTGLPDSSSLPK